MKKTLIIVLGETRAYEITYDSFARHLVNPFKADVALCVGNNARENLENPFYKNAKFVWTFQEKDDWGAALDKICNDRTLSNDWRLLLQLKGILFGGVREAEGQSGSGAIGLVFRAFLKQCLIESGVIENYDRFIITRSDFFYNIPHLPPDLLDENYIWIPDGERYGGVTDRHVVCSRGDLLGYLSVVDDIFRDPKGLYDAMDHDEEWNIEKFIKFQLQRSGLYDRVRFYPYVMFTVRMAEGHTRWSAGDYHEKLGFYVKYKHEYISNKLARVALLKSERWSKSAILRYKLLKSGYYAFCGEGSIAIILIMLGFLAVTIVAILFIFYYKL